MQPTSFRFIYFSYLITAMNLYWTRNYFSFKGWCLLYILGHPFFHIHGVRIALHGIHRCWDSFLHIIYTRDNVCTAHHGWAQFFSWFTFLLFLKKPFALLSSICTPFTIHSWFYQLACPASALFVVFYLLLTTFFSPSDSENSPFYLWHYSPFRYF